MEGVGRRVGSVRDVEWRVRSRECGEGVEDVEGVEGRYGVRVVKLECGAWSVEQNGVEWRVAGTVEGCAGAGNAARAQGKG